MAKVTDREVTRLIDAAVEAGCRIHHQGRKHVVLATPAGGLVTVSRTPSDHRAIHNMRADLRRNGVPLCG